MRLTVIQLESDGPTDDVVQAVLGFLRPASSPRLPEKFTVAPAEPVARAADAPPPKQPATPPPAPPPVLRQGKTAPATGISDERAKELLTPVRIDPNPPAHSPAVAPAGDNVRLSNWDLIQEVLDGGKAMDLGGIHRAVAKLGSHATEQTIYSVLNLKYKNGHLARSEDNQYVLAKYRTPNFALAVGVRAASAVSVE